MALLITSLRGPTATQRSKKGSEKVLGKGFWGKGSGGRVLRGGRAFSMGFIV